MLSKQETNHGYWSSQLTFLMAATGSAIGLANLWKFPYLAGTHGGGFVIAYLTCLLLVGIPIAIAEVVIGRQGRSSPIGSMRKLVSRAGSVRLWRSIGPLAVITGFLILALYSVVGGMSLAYVFSSAFGEFTAGTQHHVINVLRRLQSSPSYFASWHTLFLLLVVVVLARGVNRGIGQAVRVLIPLMFLLLIVLLAFSIHSGDIEQGVNYLFNMQVRLTPQGWLDALGLAFFTLGIGTGAMMVYGAYMPQHGKVGRLMLTVAVLDLSVALAAGLVIFPILFANDLPPIAGFGLIFHSIPLAYSGIEGGQFFSVMFFVLVTFAAWSSAIAVMEPAVAWLEERFKTNRRLAAFSVAIAAWGLGLAAILSFSVWRDVQFLGIRIFNGLDIVTSRLLLPLVGFLISMYLGWFLKKEYIASGFANYRSWFVELWHLVLRWFAPLAIVIIFTTNLVELGEELCSQRAENAVCLVFGSDRSQALAAGVDHAGGDQPGVRDGNAPAKGATTALDGN